MTSEPFGDIGDAQGRELLDSGGLPLGHIRQIFLDETTREPAWATVDAPGGEGQLVLVPLAHATVEGDRVRVAVTSEAVTSSPPTTGESDRFTPDHMDRVRAHYAEPFTGGGAETTVDAAGEEDRVPVTTGGPVRTDGPATVVRSEEELVIGRERVAHERVRLVKRVVTETVTQTFELRREELHVERLPVAGVRDADASPATGADVPGTAASSRPAASPAPAGGSPGSAASRRLPSAVDGLLSRFRHSRLGRGGSAFGEDFADETVDITLMEEQVVISKRVVPRERVSIRREVVVEQQSVRDALRKERVEIERSPLEPGASA